MRYLGIDVGTKRVGIAISDENGVLARPLCTVDSHTAIDSITEIVQKYDIGHIVVGDGMGLNSTRLPRITDKVTAFVKEIEGKGLSVSTQSEIYSSIEADRLDKEHQVKSKVSTDEKAAAIILQRFLEKQGQNTQ